MTTRVPRNCLFLALMLLLFAAPAQAAHTICVDPGHGGTDPGAVGCGLEEATVVLKVGWMLHDLLKADPDLKPIMTRTTDTFISLGNRVAYANDNNAKRFASIHCNAFNGSASGIETYCYHSGSGASFDQRDRIQEEMTSIWPALPDRGGKTAGFYVIKNTSMPATLSELAFIDKCSLDAKYLADQNQLKAAAKAHHKAIRESLGLSAPPDPVDPDPVDPDPTPGTGILQGVVFEEKGVGTADMSIRLTGALVKASGDAGSGTTTASSPDAEWLLDLPAGTYTVTASRQGHYDNSRVCEVIAGQGTWCSLGLHKKEEEEPLPEIGTVTGVVYEDQGVGSQDMSVRLPGAMVAATGPGGTHMTIAAPQDAAWEFTLPEGTYAVSVYQPGYWMNERVCMVKKGEDTWCSLGLFPKPDEDEPPPPGTGMLLGVVFKDLGVGSSDMSVRLPGAGVAIGTSGGVEVMGLAEEPDAEWEFHLSPGTYTVTAFHPGYWTNQRECTVVVGQGAWCSVGLFSQDGQPIPMVDEDPDKRDPDKEDPTVPDDTSDDGGNGDPPKLYGESFDDGSGCSATHQAGNWLGVVLLGLLICGLFLRRGGVVLLALTMLVAVGCGDSGVGTGSSMEQAHQGLGEQGLSLSKTTRITEVGDYEQPVWSPDGTVIAFAGNGYSELRTVPAEGGEARLLVSGESVGYAPVWQSCGTAIGYRHPGQRMSDVPALAAALDRTRAGAPENPYPGRWVLIEDEAVYMQIGNLRRLVSPPGDRYCCAKLSPDGNLVVFLGLESGLHLYDWNRGESFGLGPGNHPSFSPDSTRLIFDRCEDDGQELTSCALVLARLDDAPPETLTVTGSPAMARHPEFSPDGSQIAFSAGGTIYIASLTPTD